MDEQMELFSNKALKEMIVPLFLEQLLIMLVGLADTLVVSYAGEAAVSGVSLVNQFNTILFTCFTALASGGAVVISQYIGRKAMDAAGESASQLLLFSVIFSALVSALVLIGNEGMLRLMFGKVESDVMQACITYLRISAYSYPALAVYNAGAALFRSMGKTSVTMYLSVASNIINVIGNLIGVFVLHAGVAGVAWPSLIARTFSAGVITVLCFRRKNDVFYAEKWIFQWNGELMRNILRIAIPNGLENGVFPVGKGGSQQYGGAFWYLSDCRKWRGAKYLVFGCPGRCCYGTGVYHSHWTVYGKPGYTGCGSLLSEIDEDHAGAFIGMESSDFSADSLIYEILCVGAGYKAACDMAGSNPQSIQCHCISFFRGTQ